MLAVRFTLAQLALALIFLSARGAPTSTGLPSGVQFVFTSDAHYGLTRRAFQGHARVDAYVVNRAMIAKLNTLPQVRFPRDGGVRAGQPIGALDFIAEGGDITNREEGVGPNAIQSAARSWAQFQADYIDGLTVLARSGARAPLYAVPGNHDASNAVGFYRPMTPPVDKTAMVEIYNRMMRPAIPKTSDTYDYKRDTVLFSHDVGGIHFVYLAVWPDTAERAWLNGDLRRVGPTTPVVVFTHDQPDAESKHFTNPNGKHDINAADAFENLLSDQFADGRTVATPDTIEQRSLQAFLARHPNIVAYFHGNSNWNQFYDWTGPDRVIALHTFRVDSPMKGAVSSKDETKLSFHVAAIDSAARVMTVRECLWNVDPAHPSAPIAWGASATVTLNASAKTGSQYPVPVWPVAGS